ncbi:hypothetical protein VTJ83DRAFT_2143 [Remersonia thermophila]|uniref:Uncharacterized protein n=1 Tax=Remersonia thermophila TaxID=72144 RepID=A0ABR4DIW0_9PEZI
MDNFSACSRSTSLWGPSRPSRTPTTPMSLSRSTSPIPGGGWATPGLDMTNGRSSPTRAASGTPAAWQQSSRLGRSPGGGSGGSGGSRKNNQYRYPSFSTRTQGFFGRHMRHLSNTLPRFNSSSSYADKEKLGRGRWSPRNTTLSGRVLSLLGRMGRKMKLRLLVLLFFLLALLVLFSSSFVHRWRRSSWWGGGGGERFVMVVGANVGGGVADWKGEKEWAIERHSLHNKKQYARRWGYDLEIVDMKTQKRYAHEWREGWEKADFLRQALQKYPKAEWFWWLDLTTYIMEPSYSLQHHIFSGLARHVYRDINEFNPLNISHPFTDPYLDAESRSPVGDGRPESIHLILSQDCSGFNLGSFFVRRSEWTDRLLDVWWDPVAYEQRHTEWPHKEQDALEELYASHPWVRKHTAFLPQRMINSFPQGACAKDDGGRDERFHYDKKDRDFLVNMAGCEFGRDCWAEMSEFKELSRHLNRSWWDRLKEDVVAAAWENMTGRKAKQ